MYGYPPDTGCGNLVPYADLHDLNLDWILSKVRELDIKFNHLRDEITEELIKQAQEIEEIQEWIKQYSPEQFEEFIREVVNKYITVGVYFGLTDEGYFVATFPEKWSDITFGTTGLDTFPAVQPEYGHLTLSY